MIVSRRNFLVSLLIAAIVLFVGEVLFHESQAGGLATLAVAFVGGLSLRHALDDRDERCRRSGS